MGSSSKGGGSGQSYDYFGTFVAAVGVGPIDVIYSIIVDGKAIWEGTQNRGGAKSVDLTASIDPKYFANEDGQLVFFYGTMDNDFDVWLPGHPDYSGTAIIAAKNFLFGTEKSTAPNIEVICARKPVCDTSLCAAIHNVFDDGQVNTVAAIAELLTSASCLGLPLAMFDATSWAAAASWCYTNRALRFCSPLITESADARSAIARLLSIIGGCLSWKADGTLALRLFKWGEDPGGLTTFDAQYLAKPAAYKSAGWGDVPTGIIVRYIDRDRKFKQADVKLDNLLARLVRGEHARQTLEMNDITRKAQAEAFAAESIRLMQHPPATIELAVRREHATQRTGDKIKADVDLEPGGAGLAQLGVIEQRRDAGAGDVIYNVRLDPVADSVPYTQSFTPPNPQAADVDSIAHALIIPLPGEAKPSIGVLAARPQDDCTGFAVEFQTDNTSDFVNLGNQPGFALRMTLEADIDDEDLVAQLTLTDGATGRDAYLAEDTAGDEITAATDKLLAIFAIVDGNGRVEIDSDGMPKLEIMSIVSRATVDSDTHDYTVLRARKGLAARSWAAATAKVWIIPGADLLAWTHPDMITLLNTGDVGYIRLASFTAYTEDDSNPLPEFEFVFPSSFDIKPIITWTTPGTSPYTLASTGLLTPAATVDDADGNLIGLKLYSKNEQTGVTTTWFDLAFAPTNTMSLADAFTAAGVSTPIDFGTQTPADQYFTLTLRAIDSSGNAEESSRSLILPGSSPAGLGGVTYTPEGDSFVGSISVQLDVGGSATKIHYAWLAIGSVAPGSYITVNSTTKTTGTSSSKRLWARASDGVNVSAWQYQDYVKE